MRRGHRSRTMMKWCSLPELVWDLGLHSFISHGFSPAWLNQCRSFMCQLRRPMTSCHCQQEDSPQVAFSRFYYRILAFGLALVNSRTIARTTLQTTAVVGRVAGSAASRMPCRKVTLEDGRHTCHCGAESLPHGIHFSLASFSRSRSLATDASFRSLN